MNAAAPTTTPTSPATAMGAARIHSRKFPRPDAAWLTLSVDSAAFAVHRSLISLRRSPARC
jgi:hypothetical protein